MPFFGMSKVKPQIGFFLCHAPCFSGFNSSMPLCGVIKYMLDFVQDTPIKSYLNLFLLVKVS